MTDEECFQIRNKPRMRIVGAEMVGQQSLRAYRESPNSVCVQIRHETRFSTVSLSFDEAREFARRIIAACEKA